MPIVTNTETNAAAEEDGLDELLAQIAAAPVRQAGAGETVGVHGGGDCASRCDG